MNANDIEEVLVDARLSDADGAAIRKLERSLLAAQARELRSELEIAKRPVVEQPFAALRAAYVLWCEGSEVAVDLEEFLANNADSFDAEDIQAVRSLAPGKSIDFGGGAGPAFMLRRDS